MLPISSWRPASGTRRTGADRCRPWAGDVTPAAAQAGADRQAYPTSDGRDSSSSTSSIGSSAAGTTTFMLDHVVAANNGYGVYASGTGATVRLYQSMLTGNTNGWVAFNGAVVQSYGNNSIDGNVNDQTAPTAVGLK